MDWEIDFTISGEPASAKNQRRIVQVHGKPRIIKSKKAFSYIRQFDAQCPVLDPLIESDVALRVDVWYASRRPDLACMDLIQDLLQNKIYVNDRQVKASMSVWNLDRENPRARIRLMQMEPENSVKLSSLKLSEIWGPDQT
jgi:Holliday junction resolvase RusA-like endonuclease